MRQHTVKQSCTRCWPAIFSVRSNFLMNIARLDQGFTRMVRVRKTATLLAALMGLLLGFKATSSLAALPVVTNLPATAVQATSATLNGRVVTNGGSFTTIA